MAQGMTERRIRRAIGMALPVLLCLLLLCPAHALGGCEVIIPRIGKADAILILSAEGTVLIDAGEEEDAAEILGLLAKRRIPRIDVMIITHFDKDHVGGADGMLRGIEVGAVYDAAYESDKKEYAPYVQALEEAGVPRHRVTEAASVTVGSVRMTILPTALDTDDDNERSLVISMTDGRSTFLFAADATGARIEELLDAGIGPHDVLKMPHHGRYTDSLAQLVDAARPAVAVITDSSKNPADQETLAMLAARGVKTLTTKDGDIIITSGEKGVEAWHD